MSMPNCLGIKLKRIRDMSRSTVWGERRISSEKLLATGGPYAIESYKRDLDKHWTREVGAIRLFSLVITRLALLTLRAGQDGIITRCIVKGELILLTQHGT